MNKQLDIVKQSIEKSLLELSAPPRPKQRSRVWESPTAYKHLVQWSNAVLLRYLVRTFTSSLPKSEYRRKSQLDDAARSVVRNIEEGWKRANTSDYINFVGYSQGSLEEVKGDVRELCEDGFLKSKPGSSLVGIGINLKAFHESLTPKGHLKDDKGSMGSEKSKLKNPKDFNKQLYNNSKLPSPDTNQPRDFSYIPLTVLYPPLKNVRAQDLTYEIFTELINKTDYLLRVLVQSLEKKLAEERKYYKVEKARIRGIIKA